MPGSLDLEEDWKALLFPDADDAKFADGYAQAVTFGLLMAKSRKLTLSDGMDEIAKALGKTDTLIGTALRLLTEQDLSLGPSLDTMVRVLDVVDWDMIAKGDSEAWLYFYEDFLETYDNRLRKLTGSYYTPPQVVQAMVRLCDEALRSSKRFGIPQGLASNQVHVADPAMGSGTYLLAILRAIAESVEKDEGEGAVAGAIGQAAKRIYGFELQFGAYAVAELRLLAEMISLEAEGTPRPVRHRHAQRSLCRHRSRHRHLQGNLQVPDRSQQNQARATNHGSDRQPALQGKGEGKRQLDREGRQSSRAIQRLDSPEGMEGQRPRQASAQSLRVLLALGRLEGIRAGQRWAGPSAAD